MYTISGSPVLTASCKTRKQKGKAQSLSIRTFSDKSQCQHEKPSAQLSMCFRERRTEAGVDEEQPWLPIANSSFHQGKRSTFTGLLRYSHRHDYTELWQVGLPSTYGCSCLVPTKLLLLTVRENPNSEHQDFTARGYFWHSCL